MMTDFRLMNTDLIEDEDFFRWTEDYFFFVPNPAGREGNDWKRCGIVGVGGPDLPHSKDVRDFGNTLQCQQLLHSAHNCNE